MLPEKETLEKRSKLDGKSAKGGGRKASRG